MIKQPFLKPGTPCNARDWCYNAGKLSAGKPLCESSTTSTQESSPTECSLISSRRARAQRVHPWRLPWRPHAYRAALRVSPASKFSERYPSFPPNFTTFGHFLQPTTTWIVLTKPSSALLCKKILAPSKVGLNRKRSDFLDLPNGLQRARASKNVKILSQPSDVLKFREKQAAFFEANVLITGEPKSDPRMREVYRS